MKLIYITVITLLRYYCYCKEEIEKKLKKILIKAIKFYRKNISPMKTTKCPYFPSCSEYGLEAIEKYGACKGGFLALWRIIRCNPFSKGGYDPVP